MRWEDSNLRERSRGWRDVLANDIIAGDTDNESPHPGESVKMESTLRDNEVGVDTLGKAGENGADRNEKDEPCTPVPSMVVTVFAIGIVHVTDIKLHVADEVVIGDENTGDGAHETCVPGEEGKELSAFDDDLPG